MSSKSNGVLNDDEESQYGRNRIQPHASKPNYDAEESIYSKRIKVRREEVKKCNVKTLRERVGFEDFCSLSVWKASVAELLGTAMLVFVLDMLVISTFETETESPNLQLAILVSIFFTVLVITIMPVSGANMNPAVSFSAALVGLVSFSRAAIYIVAQCIGAVLGALAIKYVVSSAIEQKYSLAGCTLTVIAPGPDGPIETGLGTSQALVLEIICTFVFLILSIWNAFDSHQLKLLGKVLVAVIIGIVVGVLVFASTTITAKKGYAGAGMNPARCLGAAIVRGGHLWEGHWVFWVGPGIASVAFSLYVKMSD